MKLAELLELTE